MKDKSHIKFKLLKLENALVFQILEQTDIRCTSEIEINGIKCKVMVSDSPEIRIDADNQGRRRRRGANFKHPIPKNITIFLRGKNGGGLVPIVTQFKNNAVRDDVYEVIVKSLKQWSEDVTKSKSNVKKKKSKMEDLINTFINESRISELYFGHENGDDYLERARQLYTERINRFRR